MAARQEASEEAKGIMRFYLLGIITFPALQVAWLLLSIIFRTLRDTRQWVRGGLNPGYGRWR
jgi:hypothetical protein